MESHARKLNEERVPGVPLVPSKRGKAEVIFAAQGFKDLREAHRLFFLESANSDQRIGKKVVPVP
jgi:hypothetical protein